MTTVEDLLGLTGPAAHRRLGSALGPVLRALPTAGLAGHDIVFDVASVVQGLLHMPVGNLACLAWAKQRRVMQACTATRRSPTAHEVIDLLEHSISIRQSPTIVLDVGAASYRLLDLTLALDLRFETVQLFVARGRVAEVRPGQALASASLSAADVELARREWAPLTLARVIRLTTIGRPRDRSTDLPTSAAV